MEYSFQYDKKFTEDYQSLDKSVRVIIDKRIDKIKKQPELGKPLGRSCFVEKFDGWRITYIFYNDKIRFRGIKRRDKAYERGRG